MPTDAVHLPAQPRTTAGLPSVVIPVYGQWDLVAALLQDLDRLDEAGEIIVVDDASDVACPDSIATMPAVDVIRRTVNGGFAAAVNDGVRAASGRFVALVNSDVRMPPGTLAALAAAARDGAIVGPRTTGPDGDDSFAARRWPTVPRLLAEYFVPLRSIPTLDRRLRGLLSFDDGVAAARVDWLAGSCLVFEKDVWRRVGPFDERFHMHVEELEWQRRAAARQIPRLHLSAVHVEHAAGASSGSRDAQFRSIWQSRGIYLALHGSGASFACLLVGMGACLAVMTPVVLLVGLAGRGIGWASHTVRLHGRGIERVLAGYRRAARWRSLS